VARVLVRHGLGFLVVELGNGRWIPRADIRSARASPQITQAAHLRLALEELGPTFIKLGQLLSTRPDVLPPDYVAELSKLQADAPPVPGEVVRQLIESELGDSPDALFAEFDLSPLASASIGQAHAAVLKDGTRVVVKVRRPGVVDRVHEDLEILGNLAAQASKRWQWAADYNVVTLADQFSRTLRAELDYLKEGQNAETFARNFRRNSELHIPEVFWDTTTSRVLTLERISGVKVDDSAGLDRAGIDRSGVIALAVDAIAQMVFVDGFFHADPHPGNIFVTPRRSGRPGDFRITFIDFGMMGEVSDDLRDGLQQFLFAVVARDARALVVAIQRLGVLLPSADTVEVERVMTALFDRFGGMGVAELTRIDPREVQAFATEFSEVVRTLPFQLPESFLLLIRAISLLSGVTSALNHEFNMWDAVDPFARTLLAGGGAGTLRAVGREAVTTASALVRLPQRVDALAARIDRGELAVRSPEVEQRLRLLDSSLRRLTSAIVFGALVFAGVLLRPGDEVLSWVLLGSSALPLIHVLSPRRLW
jgi:predicted unusual protein kinase regulating ubiquinone biosynthesis (AarF/ABC1/UbiB family)